MSFDVLWTQHAEAQLLRIPDWRRAGDVDAAVIRFANGGAMRAASGYYGIGAPGYVLGVRVDHAARTVLVLHLYATER
jgi:hypothetical protein